MAYGPSLTDSGTVPLAQNYVPNAGFRALEGSLAPSTDSSSNTTSPATVHAACRATYLLASALQTNAAFTSAPFVVGPFRELAVDVNVTARQGTSPTIQFFIDRLGLDGVAYNLWASSVISAATGQASTSIGPGCAVNASLGALVQFRWVITGSATPGFTLSASIQGK
jgi:hypothetical protein